jgi:hypothetical protein
MKRALSLILVLVVASLSLPAAAHYCSNIWTGPAKLVVKPEVSTLHVVAGQDVSLKVYLQNNFPGKLYAAKMKGTASGYTITVAPTQQDVGPGQQVLFTYTVKATTTADIQVSTLTMSVTFRVGTYGPNSTLVNQNPSQSTVAAGATTYGGGGSQQAPSAWAAALADKFPGATLGAGTPTFGRTGLGQLISWFGYRYCYDQDAGWNCGSQNCPGACAEQPWGDPSDIEQPAQDMMRAGVELGVRKNKLGSELQAARDGAVNAMKQGSDDHKCLAAVVGGLLWQGAASTTTFENALSTVPAGCKSAGLRALGKGSAATCTSGSYQVMGACAAAEGLAGNDAVVTSVLIPKAGDGEKPGGDWHENNYYAYMLYLATGARYAAGQSPTWYPAVGPQPDGSVTKKDGSTQPKVDQPPPRYNEAGQLIPGLETVGAEPSGNRPGDGGCSMVARPAAAGGSLLLLALIVLPLLIARRRRG